MSLWEAALGRLALEGSDQQLFTEIISGRAMRLLPGEDVDPRLRQGVAQLLSLAPECRTISMGGATEASMDSTIFEIDDRDWDWKSIPYGFPMANQRAYVIDQNLQPVPAAVAKYKHVTRCRILIEHRARDPRQAIERLPQIRDWYGGRSLLGCARQGPGIG